MRDNRLRYSLMFAALGALFFIPGLGSVHLFDWDEVNFAEISREMIILDDYLRIFVNFKPFWQKPPFFFWTQVLAMKTFGVNEFAARLPNAICGIISLVVLFNIGRKLYNLRFGLLWAGLYLGSVLPHLYFRSGIIDPWFNLFIFLGMYGFIVFFWKKEGIARGNYSFGKYFYLITGGLILGFGILTKGPVAYLIASLCFFVYWVWVRFRFYVTIPQFLLYTLATTVMTLSWYGLETWNHGPWFISEFNRYQYKLFSTPDAGHKGFPGYHFIILLVGCFPASIFAIRSFFRMPPELSLYRRDFRRWMKILFWVVLILFSIVQSKIVHYSSMCYFPLTFLAAVVLDQMLEKKIPLNGWMKAGLISIGGLYVLATIALPVLGQYADWLAGQFSDVLIREVLSADVRWSGWEVLPGLLLILVLTMFFTWWKREQTTRALITLFLGTAFFVTATLYFFAERIESYSQGAAIDFFKSFRGKDVYVHTVGYKSYAHYFYTDKQPVENLKSYDQEWLFRGEIDKDAYFILKADEAGRMDQYDDIVEIGRRNGFVFFKRQRVPTDPE